MAIGITVSVLALVAASDLDVLIPLGSPSTLDGVLEEGEWNDALVVLLDDSITLFMKHAGGLLYLGSTSGLGAMGDRGLGSCAGRANDAL